MSPKQIEVGAAYHNGKEGIRSYSERRVIELNVATFWNGEDIKDGVRYKQMAGAYEGKTFVMPLLSFAKWARGMILPKSTESNEYAQR